jgi:hypothetical protein
MLDREFLGGVVSKIWFAAPVHGGKRPHRLFGSKHLFEEHLSHCFVERLHLRFRAVELGGVLQENALWGGRGLGLHQNWAHSTIRRHLGDKIWRYGLRVSRSYFLR